MEGNDGLAILHTDGDTIFWGIVLPELLPNATYLLLQSPQDKLLSLN